MSQKDGSRILTWAESGAASFNLGEALAAYQEEEAERVAALNAAMGKRLPGDPASGQPQRAGVHPPTMPGMAVPDVPGAPGGAPAEMGPSMRGMGDLHDQTSDPGERYYESWPTSRARPGERPVMAPRRAIPEDLKGLYYVMTRAFQEHEARLHRVVQTVQPHTHLAPQITAISIDLFTNASGVTLPATNAPQVVLTLSVPDRFVVVLERFGNQLEDHTSFPNVRWSMQRNRTPLRSYGNFNNQLGRFVDPTRFASPIVLKQKDEYRLVAQSTDGAEHKAFARLMGWAFATKTITSEGSYGEFVTSR